MKKEDVKEYGDSKKGGCRIQTSRYPVKSGEQMSQQRGGIKVYLFHSILFYSDFVGKTHAEGGELWSGKLPS